MWPPRKVLLTLPDSVPRESFTVFFKAIGIDVEIHSPGGSDEQAEKSGVQADPWDDLALGCTESVVWPDQGGEPEKAQAIMSGLSQRGWKHFLHDLWQGEVVLTVPQGPGKKGEEPLLFHVLQEAGYDPGFLWQTENGEWEGRRGSVLYWIIQQDWPGLSGGEAWGKHPVGDFGPYTWQDRGSQVDFYADFPHGYAGSLPWPYPPGFKVKEDLCVQIAQALTLGIPWSLIERTVKNKKCGTKRDTLHSIEKLKSETERGIEEKKENPERVESRDLDPELRSDQEYESGDEQILAG